MVARLKAVAEAAKVRSFALPPTPVTSGFLRTAVHASLTRQGSSSMQLAHQAAVQVKLTTTQKVAIRLPFQNKQGEPIETVLTRGKLEQMAQPLYRRMREAIDAACWGVICCPPTVFADLRGPEWTVP